MIALGIDPGLARVGYAAIEGNGQQYRLLDFGIIETPAHTHAWDRLAEIERDLTSIIEKYQPTIAGIEKLFFAQNTTTAMDVAQARGVILNTMGKAGIQISEFTPLEVKNTMVGYGKATKSQVEYIVCQRLGLTASSKYDDATDALAIALFALDMSSSPLRGK